MRLALALLLLLALPASASASKVSVVLADGCQGAVACQTSGGAPPVPITTFVGAPGEANRVTVSRAGSEFVVRDDGAVLTAEAPCVAVDQHGARCPVTEGFQGLPGFAAALGDGDDVLAVIGDLRVETTLSDGDGRDAIEGGAEPDEFDAGLGDDRLLGRGGADELSYAGRAAPVRVELADRTAGEPGESDEVIGFETVVGGDNGDVLNGSGRADTLDGGPGDDRLRGFGGADSLFGGLGADVLRGLGGRDRLFGDPGQGDGIYTPIVKLRPDLLDGGAGDDELFDTGGRNALLGGPGDDLIEAGADHDDVMGGPGRDRSRARGGGRDTVDCGSGRDRARTDRRDSRRSCERGR